MGFNVLFSWNSLRIGRSYWFEQFLVVVFFAFFVVCHFLRIDRLLLKIKLR